MKRILFKKIRSMLFCMLTLFATDSFSLGTDQSKSSQAKKPIVKNSSLVSNSYHRAKPKYDDNMYYALADKLTMKVKKTQIINGKKTVSEKTLSKKEKHELIRNLLELAKKNKHPNLTYTAKSVYSPVGVPMKWGSGIGFAADVFNRYPTDIRDTWSGGISASLPFGDSDRFIGAAVSVFNPDMGKNVSFGRDGTVGLVLSRWLGANTIVTGGVSNLGPWGEFKSASKTYYGAVTQLFGVPIGGTNHSISASVGGGTGSFAPLGAVTDSGQLKALSDSTIYPFVNASFNFTNNLAIVGDYYSQTFATGLAYNTFLVLPFSLMVYAGNLKHTSTAPSTTYGFRIATGISPSSGLLAAQRGR